MVAKRLFQIVFQIEYHFVTQPGNLKLHDDKEEEVFNTFIFLFTSD